MNQFFSFPLPPPDRTRRELDIEDGFLETLLSSHRGGSARLFFLFHWTGLKDFRNGFRLRVNCFGFFPPMPSHFSPNDRDPRLDPLPGQCLPPPAQTLSPPDSIAQFIPLVDPSRGCPPFLRRSLIAIRHKADGSPQHPLPFFFPSVRPPNNRGLFFH